MSEPNSLTIKVHAELPSPDSEIADVVLQHMRELAVSAQEAGWEVSMTLTLTKQKEAGPGGE